MASSVMGRPNEGIMHRVAVGVSRKAISEYEKFFSKSKNRLVAVERHDSDWRDGLKVVEEHFLWIKARDVSCSDSPAVACCTLEHSLASMCKTTTRTRKRKRKRKRKKLY